MSIDGLGETRQKILEMFKLPEFLIKIIDEWIEDAWQEGCDACQEDSSSAWG